MGQIQCHTTLLASSSLDADPWSIASAIGITVMDLGSVNAPPPLEHRQSGVGWSSFKPQAAGGKLDKLEYRFI